MSINVDKIFNNARPMTIDKSLLMNIHKQTIWNLYNVRLMTIDKLLLMDIMNELSIFWEWIVIVYIGWKCKNVTVGIKSDGRRIFLRYLNIN